MPGMGALDFVVTTTSDDAVRVVSRGTHRLLYKSECLYFLRNGMFGSRMRGGKDAASPRTTMATRWS